MVMPRPLATAALAVLLAAPVVFAEARLKLRPGMTGVADVGAIDCALFSDMHYNGPTGMRHHVLTWVQGYVYAKTGANIDAILAELPADHDWNFDTLSDVVVDYCREHPEAPVAEAAIALWVALRPADAS